MRLTVLGSCGAWPDAGQACSGYLVEHDGFRLLVDLGYAVVPRLLERLTAAEVDAVLISHGHPDHCADLNPLLRARVLRDDPPPPLPVYALPGALDAVLALDRPGMLAGVRGCHARARRASRPLPDLRSVPEIRARLVSAARPPRRLAGWLPAPRRSWRVAVLGCDAPYSSHRSSHRLRSRVDVQTRASGGTGRPAGRSLTVTARRWSGRASGPG